MEKQYRILLAEDEIKLATVIKEELQHVGYVVDVVNDGLSAIDSFSKHNYSLALLDINLPGKSGMELCKIFRNADANISLIMLTALGEIQDKVDAFKFGADDYIVKPFHFDELMARIKAALKRTALSDDNVLNIHDLSINFKTKTVARNGNIIPLTAKEFSLLALLAKIRVK